MQTIKKTIENAALICSMLTCLNGSQTLRSSTDYTQISPKIEYRTHELIRKIETAQKRKDEIIKKQYQQANLQEAIVYEP